MAENPPQNPTAVLVAPAENPPQNPPTVLVAMIYIPAGSYVIMMNRG